MGAVIGAIVVIASACLYLGRAAKDEWFWRGGEYDKLTSLRAGFNLRYFESTLGPPIASRVEHGYRDSAFRGRNFWVQTISKQGVVDLYSVTSCNDSFQPTFEVPGGGLDIRLNHDHLSDVEPKPSSGVAFDYFIGASAGARVYEGFYGAMPGLYKTVAWGVSSLCKGAFNHLRVPLLGQNSGFTNTLPSAALRFRTQAQINTYIEAASGPRGFGIGYGAVNLTLFAGLPVGPDRILTQGEY